MKKALHGVATLFIATLWSITAFANDSAGTTAAGGIILQRTPGVMLEQEILTVSTANIHVDYLFKNITDHAITTKVFFPLPPYQPLGTNAVWDEEVNPAIKTKHYNDVPFVNFSVLVNGQPVQYQTITRALYMGQDITSLLEKWHIPLNPLLATGNIPTMNPLEIEQWQADAKKLGIVNAAGKPLWQKQVYYTWVQTFPAGEIIHEEHDYRPATGYFYGQKVIGGFAYSNQQLLTNDIVRMKQLFKIELNKMAGNGIVIKSWLWQRIKNASKPNSAACAYYKPGDNSCIYAEFYNINYILTTGANWGGPIKHFVLMINYPIGSAVSYNNFYGNQLVKTLNQPGILKIEVNNLIPQQDLSVLIGTK